MYNNKELIQKFLQYLYFIGFTERQADFILWVFTNYPIGENTNDKKEMLQKVSEYITKDNIQRYIWNASGGGEYPTNVHIHADENSDIAEIVQLKGILENIKIREM
jgi:hypothetical protein